MTDLRGGIFGQRLRRPWLRSVLVAVLVALCTALMPLRAIADDMAATLRLADERMAQNDFHRALQYYKQVADALGGATCHDERLECLKALYGCSEACFRINDYSASLDYLLMAEEQLQADNSLPSGPC